MQPFSPVQHAHPARLLVLILLVLIQIVPLFRDLTLFELAGLPGATHAVLAQSRIYVNDNAGGANTGVDWANAYTDLQSALGAAGNDAEIWVAAGTYIPGTSVYSYFPLLKGVAIYGGFAGNESSRDDRDWDANVTILSGLYAPGSFVTHVVYGESGDYTVDATTVLDGFTITGGYANGPLDTCPDRCGGGIYLVLASPTLANLTITGNRAKYGGGMANHTSNPTLEDVVFDSNTVPDSNGWGGGMYNYNSSPQLTKVDFSDNHASFGGGLYNYTSHPTLSGGIFSGNQAADAGGGIHNFQSSPTLSGVIFRGNQAVDSGGGIANYQSNPTLTNVIVSGNQAADFGGGMYNHKSNPTLTNVIVSGNQAGNEGGGISNFQSNPTLTNVTLSGNQSGNRGGGMHNVDSSPTLTNVTVSGNHASLYGGGINNYNISFPLIQNSIIWGNSAPLGANFYVFGGPTITAFRYSLIEGGVPPGSTNGGNNLSGDPHFVRAVNCGGDDCGDDPDVPGDTSLNDDYGDLRLGPTSPAIDAGDKDADLGTVGPATIASIPFDPNGAPRIAAVKGLDAKVDMGAYERINTVSPHAGGPYTGSEGSAIALNGSASSDEAPIPSYAWDCTNNGSVEATSANPTGNSCPYPDNGSYTLRLTVTDLIGLTGSATAAVTIANVVPTLTGPANQSTTAATAQNFTLGSFSDPGAEGTWAVTVKWGDSSPNTQFTMNSAGALPAKPHTYAAGGTYNVVVTVSDDGGNGTGSFQVGVSAAPPGTPAVTAPAAQNATAAAAKSFALGNFSDAGDGGPWQVTIKWGDGSAETLFNATSIGALLNQSHNYATAGTYSVQVTVSDSGGRAASITFQVNVAGVPVDGGDHILYLPGIER